MWGQRTLVEKLGLGPCTKRHSTFETSREPYYVTVEVLPGEEESPEKTIDDIPIIESSNFFLDGFKEKLARKKTVARASTSIHTEDYHPRGLISDGDDEEKENCHHESNARNTEEKFIHFPVPPDGLGGLSTALFCPVTVQWLLENYETKAGVSLPRSTVYNHYIRHCKSHDMEPVNAASFGKLIRSIFLGLQTRRLGTRGNSKYHYYGIQIKPQSVLNDESEPGSQSDSDGQDTEKKERNTEPDPLDISGMINNPRCPDAEESPCVTVPVEPAPETEDLLEELVTNLYVNCRMEPESYLKFVTTSPTYREVRDITEWQKDIRLITKFTCDPQRRDLQRKIQFESIKFGKGLPKIEYRLSSDVLSRTEVESFRTSYKSYCELLIKSSVLYKFDTMLRNCHQYWSGLPVLKRTLSFSKNKLKSISENENMRLFIETVDSQVYQVMVDLLFPNVIHPIPVVVLDVVRNFALKFVNSITITMEDYPEALKKIRCLAAEAFSQIILDNCKLNMIAESVRPLFEEAHRTKAYGRLKELNIPAALSVSIYPIANEDKYFYLVETYRQALANMTSLENYSEWIYTEVDNFTCNFKSPKDEPKFEEQAKAFAKDMSYILYVICSQMAFIDTEVNTFFMLLQLFTNSYILHLVQEKRSALKGMTETWIHHGISLQLLKVFSNIQGVIAF
ncbi:unnamed protein product [Allacma fusca]|uniref:RFX-type winged-helix domain-containing protein n=1 Tax=Allacma fusca TaxID=39272 RepID=A0A8J2NS78_9HEXA|nr:unnamed protein product [Allacma fusca]